MRTLEAIVCLLPSQSHSRWADAGTVLRSDHETNLWDWSHCPGRQARIPNSRFGYLARGSRRLIKLSLACLLRCIHLFPSASNTTGLSPSACQPTAINFDTSCTISVYLHPHDLPRLNGNTALSALITNHFIINSVTQRAFLRPPTWMIPSSLSSSSTRTCLIA